MFSVNCSACNVKFKCGVWRVLDVQLAEETSYGSRLSSLTQPHLMTMMENTFIDHFYLKSIREASIYMWTGGQTHMA